LQQNYKLVYTISNRCEQLGWKMVLSTIKVVVKNNLKKIISFFLRSKKTKVVTISMFLPAILVAITIGIAHHSPQVRNTIGNVLPLTDAQKAFVLGAVQTDDSIGVTSNNQNGQQDNSGSQSATDNMTSTGRGNLYTADPQPTQSLTPSTSGYIAPSGGWDETAKHVMRSADRSSPPRLIMTPRDFVWGGDDANVIPLLYMSDHSEISYPKFNTISGHTLSWYDRDCGSYQGGNYRVCWHPLILVNDWNTDGSGTYNISVNDRAGKTYSTTFHVTWYHKRFLFTDTNGYDKRIEGDNIIITMHVKLRPENNVGNPSMHVTVNDNQSFYDKQGNACDVSKSDIKMNYDGRAGFDAVCIISKRRFEQLGNRIQLVVSTSMNWPPMYPVLYSAGFTID
jgi:hypothetical protein